MIAIKRKELEKFVDVYINSFEKWDLAIFIANQFMEPLDISDIVHKVGRREKEEVETAINEFTHKGLLLRRSSKEGSSLLAPNPSYIPVMREFAYALDDRDERFLLLSAVLHNMHKTAENGIKIMDVLDALEHTDASQDRCWEIMHATSPTGESCLNCQAYIDQKHCWEVDERPCTNSPAVCILINCPVYLEFKEEIEKKLAERGLLDAIEQVELVAEKKCSQIRKCSSDAISVCSIKKSEEDCWQVAGCTCSIRKNVGCDCCPIYIFHVLYDKRALKS